MNDLTYSAKKLLGHIEKLRESPQIKGANDGALSDYKHLLRGALRNSGKDDLEIAPINAVKQYQLLRLESMKLSAMEADDYFRTKSREWSDIDQGVIGNIASIADNMIKTQPRTNNTPEFVAIRDELKSVCENDAVQYMEEYIDQVQDEEKEDTVTPVGDQNRSQQVAQVYQQVADRNHFMLETMGKDPIAYKVQKGHDQSNEAGMSMG